MPPRSFYIDHRETDYIQIAKAIFPEEFDEAIKFIETYKVPYIRDASHIAAYIGISPSLIRQIRHRPSYHYRTFLIDKDDGTQRSINSPKTYLKVIQWWIYDNLLSATLPSDNVHGFRKGRSYITNAKTHLGRRHILNVDIEQFFRNISEQQVHDAFSSLGYGVEASALLASLTSLDGAAPTGAPTSPAIGNLVLSEFDQNASELAKKQKITYTRYADDLTFSSNEFIARDFLTDVEKLLGLYGFSLNKKKTKFMGRGNRMEVTGLVVNDAVNLPRDWRNRVRGFLHRAKNNPESFVDRIDVLKGICGTLVSVDPERKMRLTKAALAVRDSVCEKRRELES